METIEKVQMSNNWYETVFEGTYDRFTFPLFSEEHTREEVAFIESALRLTYQDTILDVACGHGRHANMLANEGFTVTGCDITERYLQMARDNSPEKGPDFERKDIRSLDYHEQFSVAYSFFSSFGYFEDEINLNVLRNMLRALKKGGRLLIDQQNRELFSTDEPIYQEHYEFEENGESKVLLMDSRFSLFTGRVIIRQKLFSRENVESMRFDVRLYTYTELATMLNQLNASIVRVYGNIDGSEYSATSDRMIIVARKIGPTP